MNAFAKRLVHCSTIFILVTQCVGGAYAAETQTAPWVIELSRSQRALRMTLDFLPMCAHEDWDAQTLAKVAQTLANYRFESLKASNVLSLDTPDHGALEIAKKRRDDLLRATLTDGQFKELSMLGKLSELCERQGDDADKAFTQVCGAKLMEIFDRVEELTDWEITRQDLDDVLLVLKNEPKLTHTRIQSAIAGLQDVIMRHPQKVMAVAKQLTSTLKKADLGL